MEEILARVYQREEASVKRERAMAYAFSHQVCEMGMENFGFLVTFANQVKWKTTIELIMCSGGLTLVRTKGQVNVDLAMLIGVGAGKNVGLLLAHGKTESTSAQRRHRVGRKTRLVKT